MPRPIAASSVAVRSVQPTAPAVPTVSPAAPIKPTTPTTDFDAVLRNLGAPDATPPPATEQLITQAAAANASRPILPELPQTDSASDPFADLEAQLRDFDSKLAGATDAAGALRPAAQKAPARDLEVLDELESWLSTLQAERGQLHDSE
jgi:hypothetical protein